MKFEIDMPVGVEESIKGIVLNSVKQVMQQFQEQLTARNG
jgi:hypothetical protein